ncbi:hypothetical protein [Achromobacter aegrifaciens]|uniref:hypothetical protein n=1 Tax=Achromobacter aegrifaciens TaxID=1287736 RepID=UPI001FD40AD9|nr:hypothetical protein [Achromobacter aegrifaciens]
MSWNLALALLSLLSVLGAIIAIRKLLSAARGLSRPCRHRVHVPIRHPSQALIGQSSGHFATWPDITSFRIPAATASLLSQREMARTTDEARTTLARMENNRGDMSVLVLPMLLQGVEYNLKVVKTGHTRTLEYMQAKKEEAS